jgi:hypothetical protein
MGVERLLVRHRDGRNVVHYRGPFGNDYALCGDDLAGDEGVGEDEGWTQAAPTRRCVNCERCLAGAGPGTRPGSGRMPPRLPA